MGFRKNHRLSTGDFVKGEESPYGEEWSYLTNKDGLLRYWEDGLKRCCGHQVFPTITKTSYLGPEAGIQKKAEIVEHVTKI